MEIRTSEEARQNIENFTKRLLTLLKQKKDIDSDIKALKDEFTEEGVPCGIVTAVINQIKKEKKQTDAQRFELDVIKEWLQANADIDNDIGELMAK